MVRRHKPASIVTLATLITVLLYCVRWAVVNILLARTVRLRPLETMEQREERLRRVCEKYDDPGRWGSLCAVHNCGNSDHLKGGV